MKAKVLLTLVAAGLLMNVGFNPADSPRLTLLGGVTAHAAVRVDFGFFYNELAPYGDWRQLEPYGWVWYPDVAEDWRPYAFGYWVFTDDYGWTWISTDPWGSIPFHYGRWFYDEDYGGWAWVPGTEWGPAWVGWRRGGGFIGWAPLPPEVVFEPGVGFGPPGFDFGVGWHSWCFVPTTRFLSRNIEQVIVPPPRNVAIINNTMNVTHYAVINRRVVNRSIDLDRFERETRTRVERYRVEEIDRPMLRETPVRNGRVTLFRPQVVNTTASPPPAVRAPRVEVQPGHRSERWAPGTIPGRYRTDDREQDRWNHTEWPGADRRFPKDPRPVELEERDGQRPRVEERLRQRRQAVEEQRQEADKERARRWIEREQVQQQTIIQQRQADQEQVRQRAEQERAQRQAEREQVRQQLIQQQQAEREQVRQQLIQQQRAEQEQARQQAIQQRRQMDQEQARQRAEQERTQRQVEREQVRQQLIQQQRVEREQTRGQVIIQRQMQ